MKASNVLLALAIKMLCFQNWNSRQKLDPFSHPAHGAQDTFGFPTGSRRGFLEETEASSQQSRTKSCGGSQFWNWLTGAVQAILNFGMMHEFVQFDAIKGWLGEGDKLKHLKRPLLASSGTLINLFLGGHLKIEIANSMLRHSECRV